MENADEIIVPFGRLDQLVDLIEKFPTKSYVVDLPKGLVLDWPTMKMCESLLKESAQFSIRLHELNVFTSLKKIKEYDLKFFYSEPVKTFYELNSLKKLGVCYVYVDAPLFFKMQKVKNAGIPLRLIPNRCYVEGTIPRDSGLHGCWIRPEKLEIYEPYASIVEFHCDNIKQEMALWKIYMVDKEWPGDMNSYLYGFNEHMDSRIVYEGLDEIRLNCGQSCEDPTAGRFCMLCGQVKHFEKLGREWAEEAIKRQEKAIQKQEETNSN